MMIVDWRQLTAEQVAPLYTEQTRAWTTSLGGGLSAPWAVRGPGRAAGARPGLASIDARGRIAGGTCIMRQDGVVQIGALAGRGAGPVRELLEGILDAPESAGARELT